MTPAEMSRAIEQIIAEETGCSASWAQHPDPITMPELACIAGRIEHLLDLEFESRRPQR